MTAGEELRLAKALAAMRRALDAEVDPITRAEVINQASVPDEVVAAFIGALPAPDLETALAGCDRQGVLAIWAHSIGRVFRKAVADNPFASEETLIVLAADYDGAVSAAAYHALNARAQSARGQDVSTIVPRPED